VAANPTIFPVSEVRTLTLLVIWILQFMPALGLLTVATLGTTNVVSGGFITDNTTRHYIMQPQVRKIWLLFV
jgi:hypothetical protein